MARLRIARDLGHRHVVEALSSRALLTILTAAVATPILLSIWLLPPALVLPMFSIVALASAGVVAMLAWHSSVRPNSDGITNWDIAGAFVFFGCAAAMLSEPANVTQLFEHLAKGE